MPVTRSRTGDVVVIALDREQSIRFLRRSLATGTRAMVDVLAVLARGANVFAGQARRARVRSPAEPGRPRRRARQLRG
jgi:hypothetical protein